jgi:hypothetical protein
MKTHADGYIRADYIHALLIRRYLALDDTKRPREVAQSSSTNERASLVLEEREIFPGCLQNGNGKRRNFGWVSVFTPSTYVTSAIGFQRCWVSERDARERRMCNPLSNGHTYTQLTVSHVFQRRTSCLAGPNLCSRRVRGHTSSDWNWAERRTGYGATWKVRWEHARVQIVPFVPSSTLRGFDWIYE